MKTSIYRIPILCAAFFCVAGMSCHAMRHREANLDMAARLMYDRPDSALLLVKKIEPHFSISESTPAEQADSISRAVFNYYRKHGSRREKLAMYYILGRYHQIRGDEETAMFCYVSAEPYVPDAEGHELPGCLFSSTASLFEYGYDYEKAVENYIRGGDCFFRAEDYEKYTSAYVRAARCSFFMGDEEQAEAILNRMEPYMDHIGEGSRVRYFRLILNMRHDIALEDVENAARELQESTVDGPQYGPLLDISDIYLKSGFPDSAKVYLDRYRALRPEYDSSPAFYLRLSNLYDTLGRDRQALETYKKYV